VRALEESHLDASRPADDPLTPDEAAEMRQHLQFLKRHRQELRLKVNAAEDLLLNGARPPTHRGRCLHLLSKVDLACVTSTLSRVQDRKQATALLQGVVRFSTDVGVLLLYLESLAESASRAEGAAAFGAATRRIDFADISPARMRRVLDLIAQTFEGHERVQVLFGLLGSQGFRAAFDRCAEALPETLAGLFVPLRAVHEVVFEGQRNRHGDEALVRGVTMILDAPDPVLRSYPEPVRDRLLESAVKLLRDARVVDHATDVLLDTLPRDGRRYSTLGMLRAAELMRRHEDARAAKLLAQVKAHHPGFHQPARWLAALEAPRVGRMAWVGWSGEGDDPDEARRPGTGEPPRLRRAVWLDEQRPAWLRIGTPADASRFAEEARIQREVAVAGTLPPFATGTTDDGVPWIALPPVGRPATSLFERKRLPRRSALLIALQGAQVLHALALAGVELPDAESRRFLVEDAGPTAAPLLLLADLDGARRAAPDQAAARHAPHAAAWCAALLDRMAREEQPRELHALLPSRPGLPDLIVAVASQL
jgi:hypothetical protein